MFTYLSTAPGSSDRSWIRLRLGDNSSGDQLLQDEEIDAMLAAEGDRSLAAAVCAETIAASFARRPNMTVGRLSISATDQSKAFTELAKRLRSEASMRVAPWAGGISIADKEDSAADTDRVQPGFTIGQYDYPGSIDGSTAY